MDYVGAPLAAANRYGKENPMAAGYQAGQCMSIEAAIYVGRLENVWKI